MEITEKDVQMMKNELFLSLLKHANGKIKQDILRSISDKAITIEILRNEAFAHKGVNWYAKEILDRIDFNQQKKN